MSKNARDKRPYVIPVTRIELSEKNIKLRTILIVLLLAVAAVALATGLFSLLNVEPGWQEIEVSSGNPNSSSDFTLNYYFGESGMSATAEQRQINQLYTAATEDAYRIFSPEVSEEGLYNVGYVNAHINEEITVDEVLYRAFELIEAYDNRNLYLAPVYVEYNRIFMAQSASEAAQFDPNRDQETAEYVRTLASFANDPEMIDLELLGDNRIRLNVSDAYLTFADEYELDSFIDFGWMKNAFIIDYIAEILNQNGFTSGYLASYDGFTRNLDTRGESYSMNLFDRVGDEVNLPAVMRYDRPVSIVFLRDYPMGERDNWHYYSYADGEILTIFVDPADGMNKSSVHNLVSYSYDEGCAEILMMMAPVFISDGFSEDALSPMAEQGVYSVWFSDHVLRYNDAELELEFSEDAGYTSEYAGS